MPYNSSFLDRSYSEKKKKRKEENEFSRFLGFGGLLRNLEFQNGGPRWPQPRPQGPLSYSRERTLVEAGHVTVKISQNLAGKKKRDTWEG